MPLRGPSAIWRTSFAAPRDTDGPRCGLARHVLPRRTQISATLWGVRPTNVTGKYMELTDYLRIMRQRWVTIVLVVLVAIAASATVTWQMTPQYESTDRLFITTPQSDTNEAYQGGMFSQQRVKSYVNLLSGEAMAQRVKSELDLQGSARDLSEKVNATSEPDTVMLSISVSDPDPERAQLLTQTYADQFVDYVKEL